MALFSVENKNQEKLSYTHMYRAEFSGILTREVPKVTNRNKIDRLTI